jgi:hypothetical protein
VAAVRVVAVASVLAAAVVVGTPVVAAAVSCPVAAVAAAVRSPVAAADARKSVHSLGEGAGRQSGSFFLRRFR